MFMLIIMTLMCAMNFILSKHPLSKGMNLLLYTILIAMFNMLINLNSWYSYILFLIMVGGMLILFIYMTSIASNKKFKFTKTNLMLMIISILSLNLYFILDKFYLNKILHLNSMFHYSNFIIFKNSMIKYLHYPHNILMFMMIIYLLITLIAIVKITSSSYGPLRQKF